MDWASLIGLVVGLGAILLGQVAEGGRLASLFQPAALVIVLAGTLGAVMLQTGMANFGRGMRMAQWVIQPPTESDMAIRQQINLWSSTARREGLLSLERYIDDVEDPFMKKGLMLIVDGVDPHKIRSILETEINSYERRERQSAKIWEAAGGYAPTIGILSAVLGLIQVMENLTEPAKLGSGIAVAFVATIYGVGFANLVFLPIGNKLKSHIADQVRRREMITDLFCSIANGDNSRVLDERIGAYMA